MDWSNEPYVRLFTRDTPEWIDLEWQARPTFYELMRKVDRAGVLEMGKSGTRALARVLNLPLEVVEVGLPELLKNGCVVQRGTALVIPNFLEAQECVMSDKLRKRESRAKRRAAAMAGPPAKSDDEPGPVTNRDQKSRRVTPGHAGSHEVTLDSAGLAFAGLDLPAPQSPPAPAPPEGESPAGPVGGFESGVSSFGQGDPSAPEPDPSQAEPASALPTRACLVLKLYDPAELTPTPANDPEVPPMPLRDDHTLPLFGLDPQEAPRRPDAPPSRASGARRRPGQGERAEVAGGSGKGRKNDPRELIEEPAEDEATPPKTQKQKDHERLVKYGEAYARGMKRALGLRAFPLSTRDIDDMAALSLHMPEGQGPCVDWLERVASEFVEGTRDRAEYMGGYKPYACTKWLNAKAAKASAPAGAQRHPGTYHGMQVQTDEAARRERERLEKNPNRNTVALERDAAILDAAGLDPFDDYEAARALLDRERGAA